MDYKVKLNNITSSTDIIKIDSDGIPYALCQLIKGCDKKIFLHIVQNDLRALQIQDQLKFLYPELNILNFSAWDCLPYDNSSPKPQIIASRIETLSFLASSFENSSSNKTLIIATINSVIQKTIPIGQIKKSGFIFKIGDELNLKELTDILIKNGYSRSPNADNIGEFAIRGSIVDIVIQHTQDKVIASIF